MTNLERQDEDAARKLFDLALAVDPDNPRATGNAVTRTRFKIAGKTIPGIHIKIEQKSGNRGMMKRLERSLSAVQADFEL